MASPNSFGDLLSSVAFHFSKARPTIPMYIHLIISALFPIYTGAHASLSRPSSAAKPDKSKQPSKSEDEDEDEEKAQKMESLSNTDAIVLPVTAGVVLAGLYFLIMKYGADIINLIMGYYFSGIGIFSVYKLVNDALNVLFSLLFPTYFADGGTLWQINSSEQKAVPYGGDFGVKADLPTPVPSTAIPLPQWAKDEFWRLRRSVKQKYTVEAYVHGMLELCTNITIVNIISAIIGLATIIYVNTVSKPWFLTNLQGFAVSYSALQLMSPTTFATGSLILGSLFCYDVWAVFFTPLMVTVAKNLDVPIKLVFPRPDEPSEKPGEPPVKSYSMLGLGDVVLPGIMIGLALRFDLYMFYLKKQQKAKKASTEASTDGAATKEDVKKAPYVSPTGRWGDRLWTWRLPSSSLPPQLRSSFPKPYFTSSVIGYIIGMLATLGVMSVFQHAQPALLYLVPGVLVSLWGTALAKGEVKDMWEFSEAVTGEQADEDDSKEKSDSENVQQTKAEVSPKGLFERLWQEVWQSEKKPEAKATSKANDSAQSSGSNDSDEQGTSTSESSSNGNESRDLLFSFSLRRYNPKSTPKDQPASSETTTDSSGKGSHSQTPSEGSDEAVMVSSTDLDATNGTESAPRYRTRGAQADAVDKA